MIRSAWPARAYPRSYSQPSMHSRARRVSSAACRARDPASHRRGTSACRRGTLGSRSSRGTSRCAAPRRTRSPCAARAAACCGSGAPARPGASPRASRARPRRAPPRRAGPGRAGEPARGLACWGSSVDRPLSSVGAQAEGSSYRTRRGQPATARATAVRSSMPDGPARLLRRRLPQQAAERVEQLLWGEGLGQRPRGAE